MIRDWAWNDGDFVPAASGDVAVAEDTRVIAQDLTARLISPPGSHWAFPEDGLDTPKFVQATADDYTLLELRQDVELECSRDARVVRASAELDTLDLRTGQLRVIAELSDVALALRAPLPTSLPPPVREYGTFFVASRKGAVLELAGNLKGRLAIEGDDAVFIDMNPAHFGPTGTITLTVGDQEVVIDVIEINV